MAGVLMLQLEVPQETMPIKVQPFPVWYTRGPPESPCGEDSCLVLLAHAPNWSLPPQPPEPLARCWGLNIWLHKWKTPCTLLLHPPCDVGGAQQDPSLSFLLHPPCAAGAWLLTWQELAPAPPAQIMALVMRLPQYCMHWLWEIRGTVTCCRTVAKAWARGKKHH